MIHPFSFANPGFPWGRDFAVRLPGGTNATTAVFGLGPVGTVFNLGSNWRLRVRHRPVVTKSIYILSLSSGSNHFAIVRNFLANRYELYAQGNSSFRVPLPQDTAAGNWYDVDFEYDGTRLYGRLNGVELVNQAMTLVAPSDATNGMTLRFGTVDPAAGSDSGDYSMGQVWKNGNVLVDYQFSEGFGLSSKESASRFANVFSAGNGGNWSWVTV